MLMLKQCAEEQPAYGSISSWLFVKNVNRWLTASDIAIERYFYRMAPYHSEAESMERCFLSPGISLS